MGRQVKVLRDYTLCKLQYYFHRYLLVFHFRHILEAYKNPVLVKNMFHYYNKVRDSDRALIISGSMTKLCGSITKLCGSITKLCGVFLLTKSKPFTNIYVFIPHLPADAFYCIIHTSPVSSNLFLSELSITYIYKRMV